MKRLQRAAGWLIAAIVWLWRASCRYSVVADPRPALRRTRTPYVYALLHAHQVAGVFCSDEPRLGAMVSRSADGDLLVPSLYLRGITPVRGSSRKGGRDKGGMAALAELAQLARTGAPALLAVDGPRGPRNRVHRGAVHLAQQVGGVILPVVVVSQRRWILRRTWDRMQLPWPFCRIQLIFGEPIAAPAAASNEVLRQATEAALRQLELAWDPDEAAAARPLLGAQP